MTAANTRTTAATPTIATVDVAIRRGVRERATSLPHILGHEIAGTVAAVGRDVSGLDVGDRVASTLYLVCGRCRWCLRGRETICENFGGHVGVNIPGGYAEFVVVPARNLVPIPDGLSMPEASILANAIGTPYHAITVRMRVRPGDRLVVTGAGGGVGLHAVQIGVMAGAEVMAVDLGRPKLDRARSLGASATIDPTETELGAAIHEWTNGVGADGVLEFVGPATMPATLGGLSRPAGPPSGAGPGATRPTARSPGAADWPIHGEGSLTPAR